MDKEYRLIVNTFSPFEEYLGEEGLQRFLERWKSRLQEKGNRVKIKKCLEIHHHFFVPEKILRLKLQLQMYYYTHITFGVNYDHLYGDLQAKVFKDETGFESFQNGMLFYFFTSIIASLPSVSTEHTYLEIEKIKEEGRKEEEERVSSWCLWETTRYQVNKYGLNRNSYF